MFYCSFCLQIFRYEFSQKTRHGSAGRQTIDSKRSRNSWHMLRNTNKVECVDTDLQAITILDLCVEMELKDFSVSKEQLIQTFQLFGLRLHCHVYWNWCICIFGAKVVQQAVHQRGGRVFCDNSHTSVWVKFEGSNSNYEKVSGSGDWSVGRVRSTTCRRCPIHVAQASQYSTDWCQGRIVESPSSQGMHHNSGKRAQTGSRVGQRRCKKLRCDSRGNIHLC